MRGKASPVGLLTITAALIALAFAASPARAEFGIAKFEALTCKTDLSAPGLGNWEANGDPCLASDPESRFYTQAAGHPNFGITAFLMNQVEGPPPLPDGFIKQIRTELPEGLGVNPEATPQCTRQQLAEIVVPPPPIPITKCATEVPLSQVGVNYLTTLAPGPVPPEGTEVTIPVPVYNLEPEFGEPSAAGFNATGEPTILESDLAPTDQHISFTIHDIESPLAGGAPVIGSRLVFEGQAGEGYLTMPSNCAGPQVTDLIVKSHPYPIPPGPELTDTARFETSVGADGCDAVPFDPGLGASSGDRTDSPEPATIDVQLPYDPDPEAIQTSHLLTADVTLPEGAGLNASLANGLQPCTDAQYGKGTNNPIGCPPSSRIGSLEVETPALPETLGGDVYVAQPLSNDPSSGNQFRIFLHVDSPKFGVDIRLVGNVFPNLQTGQLRAVVDDNPQQPFTSFKVHLNGGPRGALSSPYTCGPHTVSADFTPFSRPQERAPASASFNLSTLPDGGPCPKGLGDRPFDVTYAANTQDQKAGAFAPFKLRVTRPDGAQELKRIDVKLPPGMVARLRGLQYCPEQNIAAAANLSGSQAQASPPCPSTSFVGTSRIAVGAGSEPFNADGFIYLAGPYKGAPVSLVFVTPGVAGPYDIGTVVVRAALNLDPETVEVHAVSDAIPHVFGGVKLDVRSVELNIDRNRFTINPTTCRQPFPVAGELFGGGANPADANAWTRTALQNAFWARQCRDLKFQPKFFARIFGGKNQMRRNANPKFRAILSARGTRDANLRRAAFILPRATILDQSHIRTICTRVQLAANNCPKAAIYGHATATSPLIRGQLKGPVYLTSSSNELPDLLADLRGQVNVRLRGVISAKGGRLKTVFRRVPDVPVNKFVLVMKGGNRGLLVNSTNLCQRKRFAFLNLLAQNQRRMRVKRLRLNIPGCRGGGKKRNR